MKSELREDLSDFVGRRLHTYELVEALGISRSAYYLQREEDRLISADNLVKLSHALAINPVDLLLRYGFIGADDIRDAVSILDAREPARRQPVRGARLTPRTDAPPIF